MGMGGRIQAGATMTRIFRYTEDLLIATALFFACFMLYGICKEQLQLPRKSTTHHLERG